MAEKKPKRGRPPIDDPRNQWLKIRLSADEARRIEQAAATAKKSVSRHVRDRSTENPMSITIAQRVSRLYRDDGMIFTTPLGIHLTDLCARIATRTRFAGDTEGWTFSDGSRIVTAGGGWDFGYTDADCACWMGVGHTCLGNEDPEQHR